MGEGGGGGGGGEVTPAREKRQGWTQDLGDGGRVSLESRPVHKRLI